MYCGTYCDTFGMMHRYSCTLAVLSHLFISMFGEKPVFFSNNLHMYCVYNIVAMHDNTMYL